MKTTNKTAMLNVRCTKAELIAWKTASMAKDIGLSKWIRGLLNSHSTPISPEKPVKESVLDRLPSMLRGI